MKRFYFFLAALGALLAGVLSSIAVVILTRLLLPESIFSFTYGPEMAGVLSYARILGFAAFFMGTSGAVAALLSPARWPGPALGIGWLLAGAADSSGDWSFLRGALLGVLLLAPLLAHSLVLAARRRRRTRIASLELELGKADTE